MQHRYTGDIGDFAKYGLLRALAPHGRIGVAWYLYPDEAHNKDGRHIGYLQEPHLWQVLDPELYSHLTDVVSENRRTLKAIEQSAILPNARYANAPLECRHSTTERRKWRQAWFETVIESLSDCSIIFADPDNGLCDDDHFSASRRKDWKRMPLSEANAISNGATGVFYHHNTRRPGGHREEIAFWMKTLNACDLALYWRRYSNRTFFVTNANAAIRHSLKEFAARWSPSFELIERDPE